MIELLDGRKHLSSSFGDRERPLHGAIASHALHQLCTVQQKLEQLVEHHPLAILQWDPQGHLIEWNPAAQRLFGYSDLEVLEQPRQFFFSTEAFQGIQPVSQTTPDMSSWASSNSVIRVCVTKTRELRLCEWHEIPLKTPQGELLGSTSIVQDITHRYVLDANVNHLKKELEMQVEVRTVTLKHLITQLQQEIRDRQRVQADLKRANDQLEERVTARTIELERVILQLQDEVNEHRRTDAALCESEARFQRVADNLPGMIFQCQLTQAGQITFPYVSSACWELAGVEPEQVQRDAQLLLNGIHPEDASNFLQSLHDSAQTLQTWNWEGRVVSPTGVIKWMRSLSRPELQPDGSILWDGLWMDVSDRAQAERALQQAKTDLECRVKERTIELQQSLEHLQWTQAQLVHSEKMSALGQLVAGIAHEINNPVSFIYGNLKYVAGYAQDLAMVMKLYQHHYPNPDWTIREAAHAIDLDFTMSDLPNLLQSMKVGAERIHEIVTSLRSFSRLDEAEFKRTHIHTGLDSTLLMLQHRLRAQAQRPAIQVIKDYADLPPVFCYAGQMNQVFLNILSNAIDALDESNVPDPTIQIQTVLQGERSAEFPATHWVIRITNNGPEIPETVQQRLFDPFFTTKQVGQGTGLGLSISYQVVTKTHEGQLRCLSSPDRGTTFEIAIPFQTSARLPNFDRL